MNNYIKTGTIVRGDWILPYRIEGIGKPALVIGSILYYSRTFSPNLRHFLQFIFMDHRGFATPPTHFSNEEFSLDILIDDIEHMRKALGLEKIIIIGHSGHGYMALEYAKKYPQHVSHVVLLGMGPDQSKESHESADQYFQETVCPERKGVLEQNLKKLPTELKEHPERRFIIFALRLGARSWYDYNFDAVSLWQGVTVNMAMFDYVWGEIFRDIDITKDLEKFDIPVFLGLGVYDYLVAPFYTWNTIRPTFKNLTFRLFAKSGHTPQYEEQELFNKELLEWLQISKK